MHMFPQGNPKMHIFLFEISAYPRFTFTHVLGNPKFSYDVNQACAQITTHIAWHSLPYWVLYSEHRLQSLMHITKMLMVILYDSSLIAPYPIKFDFSFLKHHLLWCPRSCPFKTSPILPEISQKFIREIFSTLVRVKNRN